MIPHPATVHFPLAISFLFPPLLVLSWLGVRRGWYSHKIYYLSLGLAATQLISSGIAYFTGLRSAAFAVGDGVAIERHGNAATLFIGLWVIISLSLLFSLLHKNAGLSKWRYLLVATALAQVGVAVWLGHLGGILVFG